MRRLMVIACTVVLARCGRRPMPDAALFDSLAWGSRAGAYAGKPVEIKVNTALDSLAGKTSYRHSVAISAALKQPLENGLPDSSERELLRVIESDIVRLLVQPHIALSAAQVATDGRYDFTLYAADPQQARGAAAGIQAGAALPLDITIKADAGWTTYKWFNNWR